MRLHVFICVFYALKSIKYIKRVFSSKYRVLGQSTSVLLKNAFTRKEKLVLALDSLILHYLLCLNVFQYFQCVETYKVHKTRFSAFNVVFAE